MKLQTRVLYSVISALSISLAYFTSYADVPVNTINSGSIIHGGTYYNTAGNVTAFRNTGGGGLWLRAGNTVRGLEVSDPAGNLTGNGGAIHLYAPGSVVRLDGNINVQGVQNGTGRFIGNGGNVFINSAYLYQSGQILANGVNGGLVQIDVGSMTQANGSRIMANGFGGNGGIVSIHASGPVDQQRRSVIDTSGRVNSNFDSNVINIEGGLVYVGGILRANGVNDRGGTVRLVSTGQSDLTQSQLALHNAVKTGALSSELAININNRQSVLKSNIDGDVYLPGGISSTTPANILALGTGSAISPNNDPVDPNQRAGDGGTIIISAQRNIYNGGTIQASGANGNIRGGSGGTISINAASRITNNGLVNANGRMGQNGGNGGLIAMSYTNALPNSGLVSARGGRGTAGRGGHGGLIILSSTVNPRLNGIINASLGFGNSRGIQGSVVAPDPVRSTNTLIGIWRRTQPIEVVTNAENYLILMRNNISPTNNNLTTILNNAHIRSIQNQSGFAANTLADKAQFDNKLHLGARDFGDNTGYINNPSYFFRNLVISNATQFSSTNPLTINPSHLDARGSARDPNPLGFYFITNDSAPFNTMTLLSKGNLGYVGGGIPTLSAGGPAVRWGLGLGGGHFSSISNDFNGQDLIVGGKLSGGSVNIAATHTVNHLGTFEPISVGNTLFDLGNFGATLYGGSLIVKSSDIHSPRIGFSANGLLIGGSGQLIAKNITLLDTSEFSNSLPGALSINGERFGGSLYMQAPSISNNDTITATGDYGGFIHIKGAVISPTNNIDVTGNIMNGEVVIRP